MNRVELSSLFLKYISKSLLSSQNVNITSHRCYRFGRKVNVSGLYVSPTWYDDKLLDTKRSTQDLLGNVGIINQQNKIFDQEKARQRSLITRAEKIEVQLEKPFPNGKEYLLVMNANLSTPYDCAAHISQLLMDRSALAVVDETEFFDMHRPLEKSCQLRLLHYKHPDTMPVNLAFWRSCSMLLGSALKKAFKDEFSVQILSKPTSDLRGGSFVCDVNIKDLHNWNATSEELRSLTSLIWEEASKNHKFERLPVNLDIAKELFAHNPFKLAYIDSENKEQFIVYRVGDHIELCDEPMIANTSQIYPINVTAIHPLKTSSGIEFYRVQGVALPRNLYINSFAFKLIQNHSTKLNPIDL